LFKALGGGLIPPRQGANQAQMTPLHDGPKRRLDAG